MHACTSLSGLTLDRGLSTFDSKRECAAPSIGEGSMYAKGRQWAHVSEHESSNALTRNTCRTRSLEGGRGWQGQVMEDDCVGIWIRSFCRRYTSMQKVHDVEEDVTQIQDFRDSAGVEEDAIEIRNGHG